MSSSNSENLKSIGLKATFPRLKILDLFQKVENRHLTAEDVVRAIRKAAGDRRRIHWVVDKPKTALLRMVGKLLPARWRRRIYKDLCGY